MVSLTPQSLYPLGKYRVVPTGWPASQVWTLWRRENPMSVLGIRPGACSPSPRHYTG